MDNNVLIPRPKQRSWFNLFYLKTNKAVLNVLDIGTGGLHTRCTKKKNRPTWNLMAIDISKKKALEVAQINAAKTKQALILQYDIPSFDDFLCKAIRYHGEQSTIYSTLSQKKCDVGFYDRTRT